MQLSSGTREAIREFPERHYLFVLKRVNSTVRQAEASSIDRANRFVGRRFEHNALGKGIDTVLTSQLAFVILSGSRGKQLCLNHEKEIHFKIRFL